MLQHVTSAYLERTSMLKVVLIRAYRVPVRESLQSVETSCYRTHARMFKRARMKFSAHVGCLRCTRYVMRLREPT